MYAIQNNSYRAIQSESDLLPGESFAREIPLALSLELDRTMVRLKRNELLRACDWTQVADAPLTAEKKQEWLTYRQALRDISSQPSFPVVEWPQEPVFNMPIR